MSPTGRSSRETSGSRRPVPRRSVSFPIDVADRGDEYFVSAELPGFRKQQLHLAVRGNRLRIAAEDDEEEPGTDRRRPKRGTVRRVVHLPEKIDEKRVSASYDDGILWITLKKRRRSRRVKVE